jgi:predicted ATPase/DNA-binding CsgD family transcriptional regulator
MRRKKVAKSLKRSLTHLPAQLTSFIGREREIQTTRALLMRQDVRLLTISGPGGIGKTRLAMVLAMATDLRNLFSDGISFISLNSVTNPDQVLAVLIQEVNGKETANTTMLTTLTDFLAEKKLLLVLDNFEHLLDAAPLLLEILQSCPAVKFLVTSRALLHLPGEHIFSLPPLDLPDLKQLPEIATLSHCSSVALFVQRAQSVRAGFRLNATNAQAIAEICIRLDGLPLALELAATRLKLLSPQSLLNRLSRQLDLLQDIESYVPQRQQTVRNTIQWSYDLLSASEQRLFQRVSVFIGGCNVSDVEQLFILLGDESTEVLDGLTSLLDKSLLYPLGQNDDEPRFGMLETIREFGQECLAASGEQERVGQAHAARYLAFIQEVEPLLIDLPLSAGMEPQKREYHNLLAALNFLLERQEIEGALRLATVLGGLGTWYLEGYFSEGREILGKVLEASKNEEKSVSRQVKALALWVAGWFELWLNENEKCVLLLQESVDLYREIADYRGLLVTLNAVIAAYNELGQHERADALHAEGWQLVQERDDKINMMRFLIRQMVEMHFRGEFAEVERLCKQGLALFKPMENMWLTAVCLHFQGWAAYCQVDYTTAAVLGEQSVSLFRQMGYQIWSAEALAVFAYEIAALGDAAKAAAIFEEALALGKESGDPTDCARAICGKGHLALRQGDLTRAGELYEECIATFRHPEQLPRRHRYILACSLEGLAEIALARAQETKAAHLLGAAGAQRRGGGFYNPVGLEMISYKATCEGTQTKLGEKLFRKLYMEGGELTLMQAIVGPEVAGITQRGIWPARALRSNMSGDEAESSEAGEASSDTDAPGETTPIVSLTKREREVLLLLTQGQSNAQIAENLVLSIVTVNSYLRSIYSKLNVYSRTQAMRRAIELHII